MVSTLQFVWNSLTRRKLRTLVTVCGVAIAVGAVFSLVSFQRGYQRGLASDLDKLGAQLLVVPKGCPYDAASLALHGSNWPCYLKMSYLQMVIDTPHVAVAAPVLMNAVYLPTGEQVVYCGVLPNIVQLKRSWRVQGAVCASPGDLLVGSDFAQSRHWVIGQSVGLPGLPSARGRVAGILKPTDSADDLFVYMPLADAQKVFDRPGQITHILVRLDDPQNMDQVVGNLRGCDAGLEMNVVPLAHLFQSIQSLIDSTRMLLFCVALAAVLGAGAGLSNTILMAVSERTREIGVLRALGGTQPQIFALVLWETLALCAAGAAVGIVGSLASSAALETWLRATLPFSPHDALIQPDLDLVVICVCGAFIVGAIAGLLPAGRAAAMSPSLALKAIGGDI
jgi:putative ABC transport system permease protein